ncbi:hypothetical protein ACWGBH_16090 [Streptomyces massasporeus]
MLLRDSDVARQVRVYLLDMEYLARTQPVENPVPAESGITAVHRGLLEEWSAGAALTLLE